MATRLRKIDTTTKRCASRLKPFRLHLLYRVLSTRDLPKGAASVGPKVPAGNLSVAAAALLS